MIYIVSFELARPENNYQKLLAIIKTAKAWARLNNSSFLIDSEREAVELRDLYKTVLDQNDRLYVGVAMAPAAWVHLPDDVSKWILNRLNNH